MGLESRMVAEMLEEDYEFEVPTSMIDVVFLLLVFFLVASKFKMLEEKLDFVLPDTGINPQPTKVIPPREYQVRVDGTDPGRPVYTLGNVPLSGVAELVQRLRSVAAASPQLSVVIVGKHKTPFMYIVWALDACNKADIDNVKFEGLDVEGLGGPPERVGS